MLNEAASSSPEEIDKIIAQINEASNQVSSEYDKSGIKAKDTENLISIFGSNYKISYLLYTVIYWGGIFGFCIGLLIYNLFKMFGLDEDITKGINDALAWFATPPTKAEKE